MVWYSHLFLNFPQFIVIHRVEGFGIVNKAEIDVSLELSCFFDDPVDVGNLISGSSAFSKTSLNVWKFTVHMIDYVLCSQRWRSSIQLAKTRLGANCGSDHELLIAKFRLKLKKVGKPLDPLTKLTCKIPFYHLTVSTRAISDSPCPNLDCQGPWCSCFRLQNWEPLLPHRASCREVLWAWVLCAHPPHPERPPQSVLLCTSLSPSLLHPTSSTTFQSSPQFQVLHKAVSNPPHPYSPHPLTLLHFTRSLNI